MNKGLLIKEVQEIINAVPKTSKYRQITILANVSAFIYQEINDLNWVGFYYIENDVFSLGPFQGKIACTNISINKGMLGKCLKIKDVLNIKDVHLEKEHIACDSNSNSELVLPISIKDEIKILFDIDSPIKNRFDDELVILFKEISNILSKEL